MSTAYHAEDEPDWASEDAEDVEVGDLSDVRGKDDVLEGAKGVTFTIKKADLDVQKYKQKNPDGSDGAEIWAKKSLKLGLVIGPTGTDGEGRYANKWLFPQLLLTVNYSDFPDAFKYDSYAAGKGKKFFPFRQLIVALGYDPKTPPIVTREFREGLVGMEITGDIKKNAKRVQVEGRWQDSGEFDNTVENFKQVEG